jgi:gluconate kinase
MPTTLLESQFAALQEPQGDEHPITVSIVPHPRDIVEAIVTQLGAEPATAGATGASR